MVEKQDVDRFMYNFAIEIQNESYVVQAGILNGTDEVVDFLKADDPIQYVGRGYLLCEGKLQELAIKHMPGTNIADLRLARLLELLCLKGFLDRSDIPAYKKLGNLRNNVAHKLRYPINTKVAVAFWDTLSKKQRTQIEQKFNANRQTAKQNPDMLVKAVILRLYTHIEGIIEREDARLKVTAFLMKSFKGN